MKYQALPNNSHKLDEMDLLREKLEKQINETFYSDNDDDDVESLKLGRKLYKACMNVDAIKSRSMEPLMTIIDELGGWPVVKGDSWDDSLMSWLSVIGAATKKGLLINFPFTFLTMPNTLQNSSQLSLQVCWRTTKA